MDLTETQLEWLATPGKYVKTKNRTFQALLSKGAIEIVEDYPSLGKAEIRMTPAGKAALRKWRRAKG